MGALLALPFLLMSALLLLGCFLIVRLAVMMFPAFATLGAFPAWRGLVVGLGRTVGAALVNAVIFGIGTGVTVVALGILFQPGGGAPAWLGLVLMPLFSVIMWVALRPFRRLTSMVGTNDDHFGGMAGGLGSAARAGGGMAKRLVVAGATGAVGGAAAGAVASAHEEDENEAAPDRVEARPSPAWTPPPAPAALSAGADVSPQQPPPARTAPRPDPPGTDTAASPARVPVGAGAPAHAAPELNPGFVPTPSGTSVPLPPTEPEWYDGEDVYTIYRPTDEDAGSWA